MERESSLLSWQRTATSPYSESDNSIPQQHIVFLYDPLSYYGPI